MMPRRNRDDLPPDEEPVHIPDGFLSPPVAAGTWAAAAAGVAVALRADRRDRAPAPAALLGSLAAFVFAAQMINVPVAPGTSGHLVGAVLLAMLVGPWRAVLVMAVVLALQALLLQDGGFTAWGANLLDMGVAGALPGYAVAALVAGAVRGPRGHVAGAAVGAFAGTLCGATLTATWLALSGLYPLRGILPVLLVSHAAIGVLEAALTGAILVTLVRWRPDLVRGAASGPAGRPLAFAGGVLGLALVVAAVLPPFASALPDGLERAAIDLGFAGRAREAAPPAVLAALGAWAPFVAAVAGTLATGFVAWLAARQLPHAGHAPHR